MKTQNTIKIISMLAVAVVLTADAAAQPVQNDSLDTFIKEALAKNPGIQQAYQKWQAAEYKVKSVKSLPDPMANFGYFGKNVETRVGPQEQKYGVSQKVPFPGKINFQGRAQKKQAEMLKKQYEAAKHEVIKNVKFVYYDLFWVDNAIQVTEEEETILENLEQVARRKYESHLASQQDVIKAQVELTKLKDKLYLLNQNRRSLTSRMNSLLNRERNTDIQHVLDVHLNEFNFELDYLVNSAKNARQELKVSELAVERAGFEKSLAKMNYLPDFTFGVDYIEVGGGSTVHSEDGKDAWVAMVSVNVPLWFGKNASQVKEKKAELAAAENSAVDMENMVMYEVEDLYFKIGAYKDIMSLYKTSLIPQTEQVFDAARLGYESGEIDFLNWLDAERSLLQTRLAYYKSMTDYLKSVAYLERVVGQSLYAGSENKGDSK